MVDETSRELQELKEAADIAVYLIRYLADKKKLVKQEDFLAIAAIQMASEKVEPEIAHAFWKSYASIASQLSADESPQGIYYSHLYNRGDLSSIRDSTRASIRKIARSSMVLTGFSFLILLFLVTTLAYISAVDNLIISSRELVNELSNFLNGRYDLTRYAGFLPNCTQECLTENENHRYVIQASVNAVVRTLDWILDFQSNDAQDYNSQTSALTIQNAVMINGFLNGYVVPLFAGILGASLSLLREMYLGFRLSKVSLATFRVLFVRVALGAISGIAVGWFGFWISGDQEGVAFTPLVLGFAAGYAVEVIFSLLDRLVAVLTGQGENGGSGPRTAEAPDPANQPATS